ncbi:cytochrome P450 monooxygenase [Melanomma pulvis-pyrius CBS 109.77]|uniref:Cytochrome P450 monooxygenase n=1 Tax=Melanomma pulvis-pyrius CBS 109.77 TaxID=1314802 RepID=A0A6A6XVM7_9PLEO|nr:cytochrome P450 monooxygenase [Melanomma pulvis-pyrius CBS 109.77]
MVEMTKFAPSVEVGVVLASPVLFIIFYALWRVIYNVFLHPLRHFPGPGWAAASDFFKLWVLHTKQQHTLALAAHAKYGPIVRAAPNLLAVNDPRLLPEIYHRRANKTDIFTQAILGEIAPPLECKDWREHAVRRKRVASTFFQTNLLKLEGQVDKCVLEWTDALGTRFADTGKPLNFAGWSQWFAYDTICTLTLGRALGFVREGCDVGNLIKNFHSMAPYAAIVYALPWLCAPVLRSAFLRNIFLPNKMADQAATDKLTEFQTSLAEDREKEKQKVVNNILAAKNEDGKGIEVEEAGADSFILMVLASDTTSGFFCGFVEYVMQTEGVYTRLMAEIAEADRRGDLSSPVATFEEIQKLSYFEACHLEVLRYQPSASILLSRLVGEGGLNLHGKWVPPGTEIGANPHVVNRDKTVFGEDADTFRPDRWLESEDHSQEMERYMLTWGYGTRMCLGKNIATIETYKLLLQFFRLFYISTEEHQGGWRKENLGLITYYDMWLRIKHRVPLPLKP